MRKQFQWRVMSRLNMILLAALFALCAWLSTKYTLEVDLTRSGRHTLSRASIQVLDRADKPLSISAYARPDSQLRSLIRAFVGRFQRVKEDISLEFVNPDAAPDEVRRLGINVHGELVLRYDGRSEHVRTDDEQEFINALQRLLRKGERWLAFLDGHGERHPSGSANHDLGAWAKQLQYRGFRFRPLNLMETRAVPRNTSVLIIASPLVDVLPGEVEIIRDYLQGGGNLLWLVDPGTLAGLDSVAQMLGVRVDPGVVIDTAGQLLGINDPTIALTTASLYPAHPLTEDFRLPVFFPRATAISSRTDVEDWTARPVLLSGDHTWLERSDLKGEVEFNPLQERRGPLTLGLGLERQPDARAGPQRVLVVGDGDFLSNTYVGNSGNLELGMRMINWLASDDRMITIPPRTVDDARLNMPQVLLGVFGITLLLALPLVLLASGFLLWWRRKRR